MKQSTIIINLKQGLEARAVAVFVQTANKFSSKIYVEVEEKKINAKSIMGMMSLGLQQGETISILADGEDEEQALSEIEQFLGGNESV